MSSIGGLLILALLGGFCAALSARTGVQAALLPLPTLGCVAVVLLVGASPNGQASFATLTHRCTSAARAMLLSGRPVMQINGT